MNPHVAISCPIIKLQATSYFSAALISSYEADFSSRTVRSTTETLGVGTRKAIPVSFPFSTGSTLPTAYKDI
jgi:hypothetical protein